MNKINAIDELAEELISFLSNYDLFLMIETGIN